jgi:hypothetical protein
VVLTPRRWCQVGGGNSAGDGVNKPITGESTKKTVKTIARGMPGDLGVTVVTNSCAFHLCTRGCGRIKRPAFPAPSDFLGEWFMHNSGASRRENADARRDLAV